MAEANSSVGKERQKAKANHHHLPPDLHEIFYAKEKTIPPTIPTIHIGTEDVDPSTVQVDILNPDREEFFHFGADAASATSETS